MKARILLVFVLLAAVSLSAQTFRGTILGTVTDPSGAVLPGAKVTVKNVGTGTERTADTSADGSYALPELQIGTYKMCIRDSHRRAQPSGSRLRPCHGAGRPDRLSGPVRPRRPRRRKHHLLNLDLL